jgi:hypothetical protein
MMFSPELWRNGMAENLMRLMENSIQIAWDYLERTGELRDPEVASLVLLDAVERMVRQGVRSRLVLSNRAISAYQKFKQQEIIQLIPA